MFFQQDIWLGISGVSFFVDHKRAMRPYQPFLPQAIQLVERLRVNDSVVRGMR